jgi:pyridinium-3,5-bisthiocarboxylic acid mononucleotide nickel chelatase
MKKGRPAHQLSVLAPPADVGRLRDLILEQTSTIGVRQHLAEKYALPRGWVDVEVEGVPVAIKIAHRDGRILRVTPEFGSVSDAAHRLGRTPADTLAAAERAAAARELQPGGPLPDDLR